MVSYKSVLLAGATTSVFVSFAVPAWAEPATADVGEAAPAEISEIVVTARRKEENAQSVPMAVTALDQQMLNQLAISNSFDLNRISGLQAYSDGGSSSLPNFSIRGRGQNYGAAAGSVETYFADVPLSPPFESPQLPPQFFDLQSLQVLKGPQGTLFGRNTTGGAVVLVPQAPQNDFGGYVRLQAGDYSDKQFEGALNIPLVTDKVLLRVAGFAAYRRGYTHDYGGFPSDANPNVLTQPTDVDNINSRDIRATLLLRPIDGLSNSTILTYHWDSTRSIETPGYNLFGPTVVPGSVALPSIPGQPTVYESPGFGQRNVLTTNDPHKTPLTAFAGINTTTYNLTGNLTLKNILGVIIARGDTQDTQETDGTAVFAFLDTVRPPRTRHNKQVTDELQVQGNALDEKLTYTLGGLYDRTFQPGGANTIPYASVAIGGSPFVPSSVTYTSRFQQTNIQSHSFYAAATYQITSQLSASAGSRYTWDDVQTLQGASIASPTIISTADSTTIPGGLTPYSKSFSGPTYDVGLQWKLTTDNMIYGGLRHGYKRGGFNSSIPVPDLVGFGAEKIDDYYLGSKNDFSFAGMRARLNAEAFYDKYKGMQVSYVYAIGGILVAPTVNVPTTKFYGVDVDFVLDTTEWLTLTSSYSYLRAANGFWADTTVPGSTIDLGSNPVANAPENKYTVTIRLHHELPNNVGEIALAPTVTHQDIAYDFPFSSALPAGEAAFVPGGVLNQNLFGIAQSDAYTLLDLRAEWNHVMGSKFDIAAQATNLTNKFYRTQTGGGVLPFGASYAVWGPPRMFYVELRTTF